MRTVLFVVALAWIAAGARDVYRHVSLKRESRRLRARLEIWAAERGVVLLRSERAASPLADSAMRH